MTDDLQDLQAKQRRIAALLDAEYGYPTWRQHLPPVDELVNCIISQNTSDVARDKGYAQLITRFPTWEQVRDAPVEQVIEALAPAGLSHQKGPRIQAALRTVTERVGRISLDPLNDMTNEEAKAWLTSINGVGPKTAAIVLCFAFGRNAFPVDTHVHRVTGRLGLIGPKVNADKAHDILEELVPPEDYYAFHLQVIQHGRQVCHARRPECERCVLQKECDYFKTVVTGGSS